MADKEFQLVERLVEKTRAKAIPWEPTATDSEFVAPYKGHVTFTVSKYEVTNLYPPTCYKLVMRDQADREMLSIDSNLTVHDLSQKLGELYWAAHDSALKVEETLNAILDDLAK